MFRSKIEAIRYLRNWMETKQPGTPMLKDIHDFVTEVMRLGAEDAEKDKYVREQIALIERIGE